MAPVLRLVDTGEGPPVVLLHAFLQDSSMWDAQVAALSASHRCLRPDLPGHGGAPSHPAATSLDACADLVWEALDAAGVGAVPLAGASLGGYLALAMARRHPGRVTGLALVGSRDGADPPPVAEARIPLAARLRAGGSDGLRAEVEVQLARWLSPHALGEAHIADPARGRARRADAATAADFLDAMRTRPTAEDVSARLDVCGLVVHGEEDAVIPVADARAAAGRMRRSDLVTLPGAGHLVGLEAGSAVAAALTAWLARLAA